MNKMDKDQTSKIVQSQGGDTSVVVSNSPFVYDTEMHRLIEQAAYLRAKQDNFKCSPEEYWLAAENDVHQNY